MNTDNWSGKKSQRKAKRWIAMEDSKKEEFENRLRNSAPDLLEALKDVTMALEAICAPESMAEIYAKEGRKLIKELKP